MSDDGRIIEVVRHEFGPGLRPVDEGSVAPTIYRIPMPPVRPEGPNFARSFGGEMLALSLRWDTQAWQPSTWHAADMTARTLTGRFRPRGLAAGFDRNDKVSGWRSAFWWALIARDAAAMTQLAEYPVARARRFGEDAFDEFHYEWMTILQTAWRHGPEAVADQVWQLDTTSRVGAQEVVDHLLRPSIDVFARLAARDQDGLTYELANALYMHRAFFDNDTWRDDPEGALSLPLLGIACWARDLGMRIEIDSDYLPWGFIDRPDWMRSPELAREVRAADAAAAHNQPEAKTAATYQRIAAILAATAPDGWNMVWVNIFDSDDGTEFAFRYRHDSGDQEIFDPGVDAVRDVVAALVRLSAEPGVQAPWDDTGWACTLERDGEIQVWNRLGEKPFGPLITRYITRHAHAESSGKLAASDVSDTDPSVVTAALDGSGLFTEPARVLASVTEKAYTAAGLDSMVALDGRLDAVRDHVDIAANAAVARLQSFARPTAEDEISALVHGREYRIPGTGDTGTAPAATEFLDALWPALITRNHRLLEFLLGTAGRDGYPLVTHRTDDYLALWGRAWQAVWTEGINAVDRIDAALKAILNSAESSYGSEESDPYREYIAQPAIRLLTHIVRFEHDAFDTALGDALQRHRRYWSASERRHDARGLIAWPLLATVCYAKDYGIDVDICSGYLPAALIPDDWTEPYRQDIIRTPKALHDHDGDRLFPIRLDSTGRWELIRFAAG